MLKYIFVVVLAVGLVWGFSHISMSREANLTTHTVVTCTNTTGELLAANAGRIAALIVNDATSSVYIKIGVDAVASEGIRLNANGGSYFISNGSDNLDTEVINCITASASNVVTVTEWSTE